MYSARKQLGNPLWIAKLFEYAVRQNRPSKTDVFLRQCAFALVFFDIQERRRSEERRREIFLFSVRGVCPPGAGLGGETGFQAFSAGR